jgi:hypothetical protein
MSLSIDTRRISAVYALGQWHRVKVNTFGIDAYELMDIEESCPFGNESDNRFLRDKVRDRDEGINYTRQPHTAYYTMGSFYEGAEPENRSSVFENNPRVRMVTPSGSAGVCFQDPDTNEEVYFSLLEIKGFKTVSEETAIELAPVLAPQPLPQREAA